MKINLKRAYDAPSETDGFRVYIDRLWPQGLSHETFHYDLWDKAVAPSTELREWFHANPSERWAGFVQKYSAELRANPEFAALKQTLSAKPVVTLIYSSRNREQNNAVVLKDVLLGC